jgi:hypothetical protein
MQEAAGAVLHKVSELAAHAAGVSGRAVHGSMLVEGELMSALKKSMSPFSGQVRCSCNGAV